VSVWKLVLIGWALMAVVMAGLWVLQRARRNAGIVDVAWSFGTGLMGVWFAWGADGLDERRLLIAVLAGAWGLRLGFYLLKRVLGEAEDGRYQALRERWGDRTQINLWWFFQVQAGWSVMFAAPMLVAARNPAPLGWPDAAGAAMWLLAIGGETLADLQLARFRRDPASAGQVCSRGLWRLSRHPNYFFEWLHWWAYVLIGFAGPWGWLTLFGPAVMLLFLTRITGIPPTERRALKASASA
jgi:steroid 5-alpha reductase family enzyme